jgi:hypothetical protein
VYLAATATTNTTTNPHICCCCCSLSNPCCLYTLFFFPSHLRRQGSVEPYTLIDSPAAWRGQDYQDSFDEWALQLTPQHIAELDAAVAAVLANKTIVQDGNYANLVRKARKREKGLQELCLVGGGGPPRGGGGAGLRLILLVHCVHNH